MNGVFDPLNYLPDESERKIWDAVVELCMEEGGLNVEGIFGWMEC